MSKKDFQAIARVVYQARKDHGRSSAHEAIKEGLANVLGQANPRFNRALFLEACETGKCKGMVR